MENLVIRTDANEKIGSGHLYRMISLAIEWQKTNGKTLFILSELNALSKKLLKESNLSFRIIKRDNNECENIKKIVNSFNANQLIIDGYQFDENFLENLNKQNFKLIVFDDYMHLKYYDCDIIVNQNIYAKKLKYKTNKNTKKLLGSDYVILRDEFKKYNKFKPLFSNHNKSITIFIGSFPNEDVINNLIAIAIDITHSLKNKLKINIILGTSTIIDNRIVDKCEKNNIKLIFSTNNISNIFSKSSLVVCSAGTVSWEVSFMGLPGIFLSLVDNQYLISKHLDDEQLGVAIDLRKMKSFSQHYYLKIKNEIMLLINNDVLMEKMSRNAKKIIDFNGKQRIIKEILHKNFSDMKILYLHNGENNLKSFLKEKNFQVTDTSDKIDLTFIKKENFDFIVSYKYRFIISHDIVAYMKRKIVNLHISLLPWNRGADPNLWSFLKDTPKGITIHYIDSGVDTGDILLQKEFDFNLEEDTLKTTYDFLNKEIIRLFKNNYKKIVHNLIKPKKQNLFSGSVQKLKDKVKYEKFLENGWNTKIDKIKGIVL